MPKLKMLIFVVLAVFLPIAYATGALKPDVSPSSAV